MPREHPNSSHGFTLFLWSASEPVGSVSLQDDCLGSAVSLRTVLQARPLPAGRWPLPPRALACRGVAEVPYGGNKQERSGERTTNSTVSLFSGILEYGMKY